MKTDELIGLLAQDAPPVALHAIEQRFAVAALAGSITQASMAQERSASMRSAAAAAPVSSIANASFEARQACSWVASWACSP